MIWISKLSLLSVLFGGCCIGISATWSSQGKVEPNQKPGFTGFTLAAAEQLPKPPLRVESVSLKKSSFPLQAVKVRNDSRALIIRYRLGWNARDFGSAHEFGIRSGPNSYLHGTGITVDTRLLPKNKEDTSLPFQPDQMLGSLRKLGITNTVVVIGVAEVEFEDGSKWSADPLDFKGTVR